MHSTCTSSAPALEMHSAQCKCWKCLYRCSVQGVSKSCKKCFVSKRVLQNSYVIQWCPRSVQVVKFQRAKSYACTDTDLVCVRFRPEKNGVLTWFGRSSATQLSSLCRDLNKPHNRSTYRQPEEYLKSTQLSDYDREFN